MNEDEEFEFRLRMEQEAASAASAESEPPSNLAVAANAAAKGAAGFGDMFLNAPVNAYNLAKAGAVAFGDVTDLPQLRENLEITPQPNLIEKGMRAVGAISEEREPRTAGQRILDQAIQTGVNVAASPATGPLAVARNVGMGLVSGAAAGATKESTGSDLAATAVGMAVPLVTAGVAAVGARANAPTLKNPVKTETLREAQAAGYVVPPAQVKPSFTTNKLEGIGGKAAVRQEASIRNQDVTNQLAAKAIGLPPETSLTEAALNTVRKGANRAYEAVANLSPIAATALEKLREARQQATLYFKHYDRSADPKSLKEAQAMTAKASTLERAIEKQATLAGRPELVRDLKEARQLIAKTHDVERALNVGDGNVSAQVIGRLLDHGRPLTGELKVIGKFAQAFPSVTRAGSMVPASGVSGTEAGMSAVLGTLGYGAAGGPAGLMAAGLPLLRSPARAMLLSKGYQNRLLKEPPALNQALLKSVFAGRSISESP